MDDQLLRIATVSVSQLLADYKYDVVSLDEAVSGYVGTTKC